MQRTQTKQSHANSWRGSRDKSRREIHDRKPRTCGRCGKAQHRILEACSAIDRTCNNCQRIGDFASQCRTSAHRLHELQQVENVENNGQLFATKQMSTIGRAPTISATITSLNGSATLNVLPITGADITAADVEVLKLLG